MGHVCGPREPLTREVSFKDPWVHKDNPGKSFHLKILNLNLMWRGHILPWVRSGSDRPSLNLCYKKFPRFETHRFQRTQALCVSLCLAKQSSSSLLLLVLSHLSGVWLWATQWTAACQAPLSTSTSSKTLSPRFHLAPVHRGHIFCVSTRVGHLNYRVLR